MGSYKPSHGNKCTICPQHTTTNITGSISISDCICDIGLSDLNGTSCTPCSAGYYKDITGPSSCLSCPSNSTSGVGSGTCYCMVGFSGIPPFCEVVGIISGTLQLVNGDTKYNDENELLLPSIESGSILSFEVIGNWTLADDQLKPINGNYIFMYGTDDTPRMYQCINITKTMINETTSRVECMTSIGYGGHLLFAMLLWDGISFQPLPIISFTNTSYDRFAYPVVTITSKTLRRTDYGSSGNHSVCFVS